MFLFILDSLGNSELLVILLAALIFFGPRKLPHLSRTIGKSLSDFRRASDDFKRTWAQEVGLESDDGYVGPKPTVAPVDASFLSASVQRNAVQQAAEETAQRDSISIEGPMPPASVDSPSALDPHETGTVPAEPLRKKDWL
ncbi:MAG: twin-arginine translocase TatA/TatE family subunit [Pyrinomonadaceae bacterium]